MTKLDDLIAQARAMPPMTEAELKAQRDSFVRAEVGFGSDADEAAYRAALVESDTETLARLSAEADARMAFFDKTHGGR